jgi:YhcH/YjgK/YiaL family protein
MVIDKIENYKLYVKLNERFETAFDYIKDNDLVQIASGKYSIDGDDIFAIVQEYDTKEKAECKLEGHKKYIDIQYMIQGSEFMGVTTLANQEAITKNEADDYTFYNGDSTMFRVDAGMFTIFFPDDLHMPCLKVGKIEKVKKVVIKVLV